MTIKVSEELKQTLINYWICNVADKLYSAIMYELGSDWEAEWGVVMNHVQDIEIPRLQDRSGAENKDVFLDTRGLVCDLLIYHHIRDKG